MEFINRMKPSHKSWIQVFETENKQEVEHLCRKNEFHLKWLRKDWLQISQHGSAVQTHPETKEKVWFNQAHLYDFNPKLLGFWPYLGARLFYLRKAYKLHQVHFKDGTKIPYKDLCHVLDALDANTVAFPWQEGDVLVLDNILTMHGRAPFSGKRRVLAAMSS
jgi:alpha-ketoglutarate-dependent taurine dioxygenase